MLYFSSVNGKVYKVYQRVSSLSEHNKSALTDHAAQENHDQLVRNDGDRQGAGAIFQVDQRGSTYPQGRPLGQHAESVTPMTAFLTRYSSVVSRTRRTEKLCVVCIQVMVE